MVGGSDTRSRLHHPPLPPSPCATAVSAGQTWREKTRLTVPLCHGRAGRAIVEGEDTAHSPLVPRPCRPCKRGSATGEEKTRLTEPWHKKTRRVSVSECGSGSRPRLYDLSLPSPSPCATAVSAVRGGGR